MDSDLAAHHWDGWLSGSVTCFSAARIAHVAVIPHPACQLCLPFRLCCRALELVTQCAITH